MDEMNHASLTRIALALAVIAGLLSQGPAALAGKPDTTAPTIPQSLTAVAASAAEVDLSWNASTDPDSPVAGYTIFRSGIQLGIATAPTTTFRDTTVSPSTTYSYSVDAFDGSGNHSAPSAPLSVTTPAPSSSPIQHVVIIDMENHSFDNILGDFCVQQAAGAIQRAGLNMNCDGTDMGKLDTGASYPMPETADSGL